MHYRQISFIIFTTLIFSGCTAKSKGFIEDLYSQTEVRTASKQNYETQAPGNISTSKEKTIEDNEKLEKNYIQNTSQVYQASGKIIDASYDKDVNLYVYAFLKSGESDPIIFYYDKDLRPIGSRVSVTVKDNFLTKISQEKSQRTEQKRKKSTIKTPIVEKINTL